MLEKILEHHASTSTSKEGGIEFDLSGLFFDFTLSSFVKMGKYDLPLLLHLPPLVLPHSNHSNSLPAPSFLPRYSFPRSTLR